MHHYCVWLLCELNYAIYKLKTLYKAEDAAVLLLLQNHFNCNKVLDKSTEELINRIIEASDIFATIKLYYYNI